MAMAILYLSFAPSDPWDWDWISFGEEEGPSPGPEPESLLASAFFYYFPLDEAELALI